MSKIGTTMIPMTTIVGKLYFVEIANIFDSCLELPGNHHPQVSEVVENKIC